jgi:hypothetical protein
MKSFNSETPSQINGDDSAIIRNENDTIRDQCYQPLREAMEIIDYCIVSSNAFERPIQQNLLLTSATQIVTILRVFSADSYSSRIQMLRNAVGLLWSCRRKGPFPC